MLLNVLPRMDVLVRKNKLELLLPIQLIALKKSAQVNMTHALKIQNVSQLFNTVKKNVDQAKLVGHSAFQAKEVKLPLTPPNVLPRTDV